jgi:hypothetical protein
MKLKLVSKLNDEHDAYLTKPFRLDIKIDRGFLNPEGMETWLRHRCKTLEETYNAGKDELWREDCVTIPVPGDEPRKPKIVQVSGWFPSEAGEALF